MDAKIVTEDGNVYIVFDADVGQRIATEQAGDSPRQKLSSVAPNLVALNPRSLPELDPAEQARGDQWWWCDNIHTTADGTHITRGGVYRPPVDPPALRTGLLTGKVRLIEIKQTYQRHELHTAPLREALSGTPIPLAIMWRWWPFPKNTLRILEDYMGGVLGDLYNQQHALYTGGITDDLTLSAIGAVLDVPDLNRAVAFLDWLIEQGYIRGQQYYSLLLSMPPGAPRMNHLRWWPGPSLPEAPFYVSGHSDFSGRYVTQSTAVPCVDRAQAQRVKAAMTAMGLMRTYIHEVEPPDLLLLKDRKWVLATADMFDPIYRLRKFRELYVIANRPFAVADGQIIDISGQLRMLTPQLFVDERHLKSRSRQNLSHAWSKAIFEQYGTMKVKTP